RDRNTRMPDRPSTFKINRRNVLRGLALAPAGLLARPARAFAPQYDLLIEGGRVIDPAQRINRMADVAVQDGRIGLVRPKIDSKAAADVIDASGKLVTPGLIDIHAHLADPKMTPASCLNDGVTCLIDAGSRGSDNPDDMIAIAKGSPNRV